MSLDCLCGGAYVHVSGFTLTHNPPADKQHRSPSEMIRVTSLLNTPAVDLHGAWIEMSGH